MNAAAHWLNAGMQGLPMTVQPAKYTAGSVLALVASRGMMKPFRLEALFHQQSVAIP